MIFVFSAIRALRPLSTSYVNAARIVGKDIRNYTSLNNRSSPVTSSIAISNGSLLNNKQILDISSNITAVPVRTVTKFSLKKGKRKSVKAALRRFYRLHWGGWIRPKVGRHKKMWKKSSANRRRLRQHVFCNGTQTTLLDKMVTKFWKRPKHYVEDPYEPYHSREEFTITRKQPAVRK